MNAMTTNALRDQMNHWHRVAWKDQDGTDWYQKEYDGLKSDGTLITPEELKTFPLYACHMTRYFPQGGMILARAHILDEDLRQRGLQNPSLGRLNELMSHCRSTVHMTINTTVFTSKAYQTDRQQRFAVVEPLNEVSAIGGLVEDLMCLGSHRLSEKAVVFIPEGERDTVGTLTERITQVFYKEQTVAQAVQNWFREKKIPWFDAMRLNTGMPGAIAFHTFDYQGKLRGIASEDLMKWMGIPFCPHRITPMRAIEDAVAKDRQHRLKIQDREVYVGPSRFSPEEFKTMVQEYVEQIKECFPLNNSQKEYLTNYQDTLENTF